DAVARVGDLTDVGELVREIVEGQAQGGARHFVPGRARTGQEVGEVGIKPEVPGSRSPEAEAPIGRLPGGDPANGLLNAGGDLGSRGKSRFLRHLSKVEPRQGAAGNLLAAALGVA